VLTLSSLTALGEVIDLDIIHDFYSEVDGDRTRLGQAYLKDGEWFFQPTPCGFTSQALRTLAEELDSLCVKH